MELKDIASISGKSGLYKIIKPTRTGVIVEALDEQKKKLVVSGNARVSVLQDVSIYTTDADSSVHLSEVLYKIKKEFGDDPGVESTSSSDELEAFMKHVLPNYDPEKVYPSDMKKLVTWYYILLKQAPELLEEKKQETETEKQTEEEKKES
jgi:hypothetical protein